MDKILIFAFGMAVMFLLWKIINETFAINKFITKIFGKRKNELPKYENTTSIPKQTPDLLKEIELYNQMDDNYRYKYVQLVANREMAKKIVEDCNKSILEIEKKCQIQTTKGGIMK